MRYGGRPILRPSVLALGATVAFAGPVRGAEPVGGPAHATLTAPPVIAPRPGEAPPVVLLEDGNGRRFRLSETRGQPLVLALGFAPLKWDQGVRTLRMIAGHGDRAAVLHLTTVPGMRTEDAPGAPPVPAWDIAQQHHDDTAWLSGVGGTPAHSVRRIPTRPNDGPRRWHVRDGTPPTIVIIDAVGLVRHIILRDTSTEARVDRFVLLDAAISCAGGGPPLYDASRALLASGRLEGCGAPERSWVEPQPAAPGRSPVPRSGARR